MKDFLDKILPPTIIVSHPDGHCSIAKAIDWRILVEIITEKNFDELRQEACLFFGSIQVEERYGFVLELPDSIKSIFFQKMFFNSWPEQFNVEMFEFFLQEILHINHRCGFICDAANVLSIKTQQNLYDILNLPRIIELLPGHDHKNFFTSAARSLARLSTNYPGAPIFAAPSLLAHLHGKFSEENSLEQFISDLLARDHRIINHLLTILPQLNSRQRAIATERIQYDDGIAAIFEAVILLSTHSKKQLLEISAIDRVSNLSRIACRNGIMYGHITLGLFYKIKKDYSSAAENFGLAAKLGIARGWYELGHLIEGQEITASESFLSKELMHIFNRFATYDSHIRQAAYLYCLAAREGEPAGWNSFGLFMHNHSGYCDMLAYLPNHMQDVLPDGLNKLWDAYLFSVAAREGDLAALINLGRRIEQGVNIEQDFFPSEIRSALHGMSPLQQAGYLYGLAIRRNYENALLYLARLTYQGLAIDQSHVTPELWEEIKDKNLLQQAAYLNGLVGKNLNMQGWIFLANLILEEVIIDQSYVPSSMWGKIGNKSFLQQAAYLYGIAAQSGLSAAWIALANLIDKGLVLEPIFVSSEIWADIGASTPILQKACLYSLAAKDNVSIAWSCITNLMNPKAIISNDILIESFLLSIFSINYSCFLDEKTYKKIFHEYPGLRPIYILSIFAKAKQDTTPSIILIDAAKKRMQPYCSNDWKSRLKRSWDEDARLSQACFHYFYCAITGDSFSWDNYNLSSQLKLQGMIACFILDRLAEILSTTYKEAIIALMENFYLAKATVRLSSFSGSVFSNAANVLEEPCPEAEGMNINHMH